MAAVPAPIATGRQFSLGSVCGEGSGSGLPLLPGFLAQALAVSQQVLLQASVPELGAGSLQSISGHSTSTQHP